jgi:hypothetical protein
MFIPTPCTDVSSSFRCVGTSPMCAEQRMHALIFKTFHQITALVTKKLIYFFVHFKNMNKHSAMRKPLRLTVEENSVFGTNFFARSTANVMVQSMSCDEVNCSHHKRQSILQYSRQSLCDRCTTMQRTMCVILL